MTDGLVGRLRNRAELETKCGNRTESPLNAAVLLSEADALQAHGVDEDMANLNPDMVPHVREAWLDLARTAILALQSPPAKVEG